MKKAFTLTELMVVIIVIGILVSIALPQFRKMKLQSEWAQAWLVVDAIYKAEKYHYSLYGRYAQGIDGSCADSDQACTPQDLKEWFEKNNMDIGVDIPEGAFEKFVYDVNMTRRGGYTIFACRKGDQPCSVQNLSSWGIKKYMDGRVATNPDPIFYP